MWGLLYLHVSTATYIYELRDFLQFIENSSSKFSQYFVRYSACVIQIIYVEQLRSFSISFVFLAIIFSKTGSPRHANLYLHKAKWTCTLTVLHPVRKRINLIQFLVRLEISEFYILKTQTEAYRLELLSHSEAVVSRLDWHSRKCYGPGRNAWIVGILFIFHLWPFKNAHSTNITVYHIIIFTAFENASKDFD